MLPFLLSLMSTLLPAALLVSPAMQESSIVVQPGDTWVGLAMRYGIDPAELKALNPHMNAAREPAIGRTITLPTGAVERTGRLVRLNGGLVAAAVELNLPVWGLVRLSELDSPFRPAFLQPLFVPGEGSISDLPFGMATLELSAVPATPGVALGLRGTTKVEGADVSAALDGLPVSFEVDGKRFIGVVGTGAFYRGGEPELMVRVDDGPAWVQPWAFAPREWEYQQLTLIGEAALIDQQARDEERARLGEIWTLITPNVRWDEPFQIPVESYLEISAPYGARRSYNGGPYVTYHEGVDLSAYGGTPVLAAARGTVALAEQLYVRGNTVIIDHGLGIFTGYYHMSAIDAIPGQEIEPGDQLGEVGTTGLSTGNHLHWDLLINGIWVDASEWREAGTGCWLLEGLGRPCESAPNSH